MPGVCASSNTVKMLSIAIAMAMTIAAGCSSGPKLKAEADALAIVEPLTVAKDDNLLAEFDWVIVRNGPGSWATDADWDEYLIRLTNTSDSSIRLTDAVLFDYLQEKIDPSAQHRKLIKRSKKAAKRYKTHDIEIKAGIGGDAMMGVGSAVYLASGAIAVGMLQGSLAASASTATAAVGGAVVVAPVLLINGLLRSINESKLAAMIAERHSPMPILLAPGESRLAQIFFPITPAPERISLTYEVLGDRRTLDIDTSSALTGLHIGPVEQLADE